MIVVVLFSFGCGIVVGLVIAALITPERP